MRNAPLSEWHGTEGERRKLKALGLVAARHSGKLLRGRRVMLELLLRRLGGAEPVATIDDVRAVLDLPNNGRPLWLGAVPIELRDAGIIRRVGYRESDRPEAHRRPVSVWELADPPAAARWLAEHPPPENAAGPAVAPAEPVGIEPRSGNTQRTLW